MAEIFFALLAAIAKIVYMFFELLMYMAIPGVLFVIVGVAGILYNRFKYNKVLEAEQDETEDDFEESYVPQPGKRLITSGESARMWRELDRLNDRDIFENTKDL